MKYEILIINEYTLLVEEIIPIELPNPNLSLAIDEFISFIAQRLQDAYTIILDYSMYQRYNSLPEYKGAGIYFRDNIITFADVKEKGVIVIDGFIYELNCYSEQLITQDVSNPEEAILVDNYYLNKDTAVSYNRFGEAIRRDEDD